MKVSEKEKVFGLGDVRASVAQRSPAFADS
jgi:hypothetical protein